LAGAALDGALDVVLRHVLRLRLVHGEGEAGVHAGVAAAVAGGHHDVARDAGPDLRAAGVGDALLPLDLRPLVVSGHAFRIRLPSGVRSAQDTAARAGPPGLGRGTEGTGSGQRGVERDVGVEEAGDGAAGLRLLRQLLEPGRFDAGHAGLQ